MATEPRWDDTPPAEERYERSFSFPGELRNVTGARLAAEGFLCALARKAPPGTPEYWDDILLVVTELAANAIQYAPGPFALRLRRTFDGVHVTMHDTSTTRPEPRPFRPSAGGGGIGWHLVHTLCSQVSVVVEEHGKDIHVFLPW
ncbi:anti-sigma regulatory factor (Ser/Thr protein kinase) [Streptomyces griseochromogenes]|uniref:ATPase n=1 Tax=Streptomyces griseochromogenes TaxID=68214 RepID=A0A1B1B1N5_9ACTN|nr:ATP-binding protein [Streptomyces griseochromogenes]ANP52720.1 ATPase [Streptomyces griseochromogenes]MBP2047327.1 anti-sigma regulatory factor (Ser/Thr protein kinase) [Streptomyces griseochromogenes]